MQSITSFMTVFMNIILMPFSLLAVSVFSIYYKLQQFLLMAIMGMTCALIPIVSYNYGAGKKTEDFRGDSFFAFAFRCGYAGWNSSISDFSGTITLSV